MNLQLTTLLSVVAEAAPPAGGAAIDQVIIATTAAMIVTGGLLLVGYAWRTGGPGRLGQLVQTNFGRIGDFSERVSGLPAWAAVPGALIAGSLIVALVGMMWDISLHIDDGRDEGPLANPAHYLILVGLFGVFAAGFLGMVMPKGKPSASAIRISGDWYAPLGAVIIAACGAFSLTGFPLDDVWHRIFGQDVTLWGPTHLMLLGGAAMTLIGQAVLMVEAGRSTIAGGGELRWIYHVRRIALAGALLIGLSIFQAEFDFGVPQFRFVFGPMLVAASAAVALVTTRVWLGRGSALGAVGFFLVLRGLISVFVGPVMGEVTPHFPLYIVEALVVEAVALRVPTSRTVTFAAWSGLGIGTLGLAAEWIWASIWMPIPWTSELLPEAAVMGLAMAFAGSMVGAWMGAHLASDRIPRSGSLRAAAVVGAAMIFGLVGYTLLKPADEGVSAKVTLTEVDSAPERTVQAVVHLDPPDAAEDAEFFNVTAWQGGGFHLDDLEQVSPGVYRTSEPVPVYGSWKTLIRLHDGRSLTALPVYLPSDPAIPAEGVRAPTGRTIIREFVNDHTILQREQKSAAGWLTGAAYLAVAAITLAFLALIAWALHRLAVVSGTPAGATSAAPRRAPGKRPAPVH
jgi:hypothetical protein